ncbi:MAG: SUMF1/EgtB/PvdO family nonheme iron enzyme, partial [Planctomycetota bacterium]
MKGPRLTPSALLLLALGAGAQATDPDPPGPNGRPDETAREAAVNAIDAGFVRIPQGTVEPGSTHKSIRARAQRDRRALQYLMLERWGEPERVSLPEFLLARYETTNAQWKHYLDGRFKKTYRTRKGDTLQKIAQSHIRFRGEALTWEWRPIYVFNREAVDRAVLQGDGAIFRGQPLTDQQRNRLRQFPQGLQGNPKQPHMGQIELPEGIELVFYTTRTPIHWYGWHAVSAMTTDDKEYCDIRRPAAEAFRVPDGMNRKVLRLRYADFAACPVRYVSANEALAFCEHYGVHLASEYEWERAARGDRSRDVLYSSKKPWDHQKKEQFGWFAWTNNKPACDMGPLPVDEPTVAEGDGPFGQRHIVGNVYELTRTFYDYHPYLTAPPPLDNLNMLARGHSLVAKGGSWGDGWKFLAISGRFAFDGQIDWSLQQNNRIASIGLRVVRHPRVGRDLLMHSIRRLAYNPAGHQWRRPYPHEYALPRLAAV